MRLASILVPFVLAAVVLGAARAWSQAQCPKSCPSGTPSHTEPEHTTCFSLEKTTGSRLDATAEMAPNCTTCTECAQSVTYTITDFAQCHCTVGWSFTNDGATSLGTGSAHLSSTLHRRCDAATPSVSSVYVDCHDPVTGNLSEWNNASQALSCGDCQ